MATNKAVHDMRKCQPIYDALESKNWKAAIKAANNVLKKIPDFPLVLALKALALVKNGAQEEGLQLVEDLRATFPKDDSVLSAMMATYRSVNRVSRMTELYVALWKANPTNESAAQQAFYAHVRNCDFESQQLVRNVFNTV